MNKKELIKFWKSPGFVPESRNLLKDSLALQDRAFSTTWLISSENWLDHHENFTIDVSLDKNVSVKFWKSSGSGIRIPIWTPDTDQIRLGGDMRSPSAPD